MCQSIRFAAINRAGLGGGVAAALQKIQACFTPVQHPVPRNRSASVLDVVTMKKRQKGEAAGSPSISDNLKY